MGLQSRASYCIMASNLLTSCINISVLNPPLWQKLIYFAILVDKVHPGTVREGTEGESSYSPTLSLTLMIDGVGG